ncbi:hypothetical protein LTR95_000684 [Oleoguttula sp. CCFEE 5521]
MATEHPPLPAPLVASRTDPYYSRVLTSRRRSHERISRSRYTGRVRSYVGGRHAPTSPVLSASSRSESVRSEYNDGFRSHIESRLSRDSPSPSHPDPHLSLPPRSSDSTFEDTSSLARGLKRRFVCLQIATLKETSPNAPPMSPSTSPVRIPASVRKGRETHRQAEALMQDLGDQLEPQQNRLDSEVARRRRQEQHESEQLKAMQEELKGMVVQVTDSMVKGAMKRGGNTQGGEVREDRDEVVLTDTRPSGVGTEAAAPVRQLSEGWLKARQEKAKLIVAADYPAAVWRDRPGQLFWDFCDKWEKCYEAYATAAGATGEALECVTFLHALGQRFHPWINTFDSTNRIRGVDTVSPSSFKELRDGARDQWFVLERAERAVERKKREAPWAKETEMREKRRAERDEERRESWVRHEADMERRRAEGTESDRIHAEKMAEIDADMAERNRVHAEKMEKERVERDTGTRARAAKMRRKRARRAARGRTHAARKETMHAEGKTARDTALHAQAQIAMERPQVGAVPRRHHTFGSAPAEPSVRTESEAAKSRYGFDTLKQDLEALRHDLQALLGATQGALNASHPDCAPPAYTYDAPDTVTK